MKHSYFLCLLVIVFKLSVLKAQNLTFYHYGLEDGISQETIRTILKDSNGFLWLGTQDGLNRFDGTSFTVYKNKKKDSLTISGNFINALVEDNEGNIWIGTNDNGISIYDSYKNSFREASIKKGNCSSLSKTSDGTIIATVLNEGIVIFNYKNGHHYPRTITTINDEKLQFNATFVYANSLYVSTQEGRLFVSDNILSNNVNFEEIKLGKSVGIINTLYVLEDYIWLGTSDGLFFYNRDQKLLSRITLDSKIEDKEKLNIASIDVFNDTFYIGTFNGLFIAKKFNEKQLQFEQLTPYRGEQKLANSITSNRVYDTYTDGNLLWVGTNNLDVVTLIEPVFKNVNTTSNVALNNAFILSFSKNEDYLFVGTRKGINCIKNTGEVTYITKENTNQALAFNVIRAMAIDHNNYLWVATIKGMSVIDLTNFDPEYPKIISFFHDSDNASSLSSDATRGVYVDHEGTVWVMTYGGGINRFTGNLKTNTITFEHYKANPNTNSISSNFTYNMSQDKDLRYWITSEEGLNSLQFEDANYQKPKFINYFSEKSDTTSLSSNTTLHTWHDTDKNLWVASQDGFNKFNPKNKTFKRFGKEQGLTNTFVYSITEDLNNNLWLTTNGGLFRFNKSTGQFTNYNQGDGVQSSEFNLGAHFYNKDKDEIYVGGINGFNVFSPSKVSQLDIPGHLTFTSLKIKDKEINALTDNKIIQESITKTNEITLRHTDFPCYINFSDLDLRPNKNNQFIYALNDNQWNELRGSREIQLLSLPKGSHLLQIQGQSRNKVWKTSPLQLRIEVIPPWYKSNLAYLSYLLLFLGIVYAFYRISLQRQIAGQESKRLQDLDDLKSRFITNITHEFRTPLTIILGYLGNLKERFSGKNEVEISLNTIEQNSNNLLDLVNQMLDLAKLEKGQLSVNLTQNDVVAFTSQIVDSFTSIASDKGVVLEFIAKPNEIVMDFDTEKIRQILTNLISNAIKFSPENSELQINLQKLNSSLLQIEVIDQGFGISDEELQFIFDRFFQVESKEHKVSQGTGIGLALTKELVELFKGSIKVKSKLNIGTTFTITLPITNNAETKEISQIQRQMTVGTVVPQLNDVVVDEDSNSVLIVEDNSDMARYIASCLRPEYKVSFAKDGKEGLDMAKQSIPDIVVTDVMMPIMDGFELTRKLQANNNTNHIPIIMLTSKAVQEDRFEGISSGADAYLTKPFQKEELQLRIQMLIAKRKKLQESYAVNTIVQKEEKKTETTDKNLIFLNSVINVIHQHIDDSNFGPTELSKSLVMSDSQLYRKLKAISNTSTAIFIRKVRLEKGKELLNTTDLSVSEIAYSTGFNDPNWFSKVFKEEFKESPTEFRN
ncbi:response regulator [uncultured Winogradskyella sp.]|uniref:hybrid sensor histidine kinase/response regulator transcription factor n=1 Tax=uncultured Winogradskyella sp. TaxID=395353 RepID=UPI00263588C7|nr:response regulator [uncultured Winogradskyella sp.]